MMYSVNSARNDDVPWKLSMPANLKLRMARLGDESVCYCGGMNAVGSSGLTSEQRQELEEKLD